jgi:hypothetical protein
MPALERMVQPKTYLCIFERMELIECAIESHHGGCFICEKTLKRAKLRFHTYFNDIYQIS